MAELWTPNRAMKWRSIVETKRMCLQYPNHPAFVEHAKVYLAVDARLRHLERELEHAAVRLEILTGRMRACHEETGNHGLLDEAEMFCKEARAALEFDNV